MRADRRLRFAPFLVVLLLAGCVAAPAGPDAAPGPGERRAAIVVSSNPLAAEAGAEVLRAGGNAADAAAAVAMALTVVEPHFSGIGGGAFILWRAANGSAYVLDAREAAPAASTPDQFLLPTGQPMPFERAHTRGFAVGVPGAVRGWAELLAREGELGWSAALAPAERLAADGFAVDGYLATFLLGIDDGQKLRSWPATAKLYYPGAVCPDAAPAPLAAEVGCAGGVPPAEGALLRNPDLAATFATLRASGPDAFYEGPVAQAIVDAVALREGRMTLDDLAAYRVVEREPLRARYHGLDVLTMPPPGGGVSMLQTLGILEPMDLAAAGPHSADALHLLIEASHLAFADRAAYVADPAFEDVPTEGLLDPEYLAQRRATIRMDRANPDVEPGEPPGAPRGRQAAVAETSFHTSHLLVVDHDGNVVSATATVEALFGSGMVVPGHGFVLNNELTDFDLVPGGANEVEAGKRPRSAMTPTIVLRDGEPWLVVGASGGPTILSSVGQVILNVVEHGEDIERAVAAGRIFSARYAPPADVRWDRDVPAGARDALRARGHSPEPLEMAGISQVEAALLVEGEWIGAADTRAAAGGVAVVP